jgi:hypothetical protein
MAVAVQQVTSNKVELASVDTSYSRWVAVETRQQQGILLEVVKHTMTKRGFVPAWATTATRLYRRLRPLPNRRKRITMSSTRLSPPPP